MSHSLFADETARLFVLYIIIAVILLLKILTSCSRNPICLFETQVSDSKERTPSQYVNHSPPNPISLQPRALQSLGQSTSHALSLQFLEHSLIPNPGLRHRWQHPPSHRRRSAPPSPIPPLHHSRLHLLTTHHPHHHRARCRYRPQHRETPIHIAHHHPNLSHQCPRSKPRDA